MQDDLYVSAETAAEMLGVNLSTLYAYVGRKRIRSQPVPGSRRNRYWRADIERVAGGGVAPAPERPGGLRRETDITLITELGLTIAARTQFSCRRLEASRRLRRCFGKPSGLRFSPAHYLMRPLNFRRCCGYFPGPAPRIAQ